MGQSTPFNRDIVYTDATLTVAAARQRGAAIDAQLEAERILKQFPGSGLTVEELSKAITEMIASNEPASNGVVPIVIPSELDADASDLPHPRAGRE